MVILVNDAEERSIFWHHGSLCVHCIDLWKLEKNTYCYSCIRIPYFPLLMYWFLRKIWYHFPDTKNIRELPENKQKREIGLIFSH